MPREIEIRTRAEKDLKRIPKHDGKRIARAIMTLASNFSGDVKRLTNFTPEYRLRVGDWRVLFELENNRIVIYRILHRRRLSLEIHDCADHRESWEERIRRHSVQAICQNAGGTGRLFFP